MKCEETGEQHKLKLHDIQEGGGGRLGWAAVEKAFNDGLVEITDEGTPVLYPSGDREGLTRTIYQPGSTIPVNISHRAQGMDCIPHALFLSRTFCTPASGPGGVIAVL